MTMIELAIVMGCLHSDGSGARPARHVNAVAKSAARAVGEWHETRNRWHLQFGEYPHARIDTTRDDSVDLLDSIDWKLTEPARFPLTILTNRCEIIMPLSENTTTNITFRSFLTTAISTVDPYSTSTAFRQRPSHPLLLRAESRTRRQPDRSRVTMTLLLTTSL